MASSERLCGDMYALGSNSHGQLGIGHNDDVATPTLCKLIDDRVSFEDGGPPAQVAAGGNHTILLTLAGMAWATGWNCYGQCALAADIPETSTFRRITLHNHRESHAHDRFSHIAATWSASFFVARDQPSTIYSCGMGDHGELGKEIMCQTADNQSVFICQTLLGR